MSDKGNKKVTILECTLRDGSYALNFGFTANDTAVISKALEDAGFRMIEVGHGVGLHASQAGYGEAAETDEAYMKAAADTLTEAKFGMFCIPGIARLEDVDMAADNGMGFIRVGTNVTEMEESEEFIALAKKRGMFVASNFMKSYAMNPKEFAQKALKAQKFGSDLLCIVDSAGGMIKSEVQDYFREVQAVCNMPLAYHGHNNLGLAVSHSLLAIENGAVVVDSTLQGWGRSLGNAPTEMLVAALIRSGYDIGDIDPITVGNLGDKYINPLIKDPGFKSLDVIVGYAQFHSSYMKTIKEYSSKYNLDPRKLIIDVCKVDKIDCDPEMVEGIAKKLAQEEEEIYTAGFGFDSYHGDEQR